MTQNLQSTNTH